MCAFTIDDPCFQFLPSLFCLLPSPPRAFPECVDFLSATHTILHPTCVSHKFAEYKGVFTILKWLRWRVEIGSSSLVYLFSQIKSYI